MASEFGANFHHQLRWVQCTVTRGYEFHDAMDYLAKRDKPALFEFMIFDDKDKKDDKDRLETTPSDLRQDRKLPSQVRCTEACSCS